MDERHLRALLKRHRKGEIATDDLVRELRTLPFEDLGIAKVDHHRSIRCGFPEVILCERKPPEAIRRIARAILTQGTPLLATRADRPAFEAIRSVAPQARYHETARCVTVGRAGARGFVLVVTAGTSDLPVAEEARVTAEAMGARVEMLVDVGVAGIHRLLSHAKRLMSADALVVVAGMEGALASVVGGLVRRPVIAVPTSVGYGASFRGIAPLLTMLNSCAAGVAVVNIDNGFGAGYLAALVTRSRRESGDRSSPCREASPRSRSAGRSRSRPTRPS